MKKARAAVSLGLVMAMAVACKTSPFGRTRVPMKHRAVAQECPRERGVRSQPSIVKRGSGDACATDADCTQKTNGRCFIERGGARCSYDSCFSDAECTGLAGDKSLWMCQCRESAQSLAVNSCKKGNCRTDADCNGNYCSPSFGTCGHMGGVVGYFCHSRKDECVDDSDCKSKDDKSPHDGACRYIEEVGHFKCSTSECMG